MESEKVGLALSRRTPEASPLHLLTGLWRRPDFVVTVLVGSLALALVYYWLLLRATTIHTMTSKLSGQPIYLGLLAVLVPIALVLFGVNFGLGALLFRTRTRVRGQGGSILGILIGGFGVGCPSCGAFLLSLVGVSAGLSALPFGGLELWFVTCVIMASTLWNSLRLLQKGVCATSATNGACATLPPVSTKQAAILGVVGLALAGILLWTVGTHEPGWLL